MEELSEKEIISRIKNGEIDYFGHLMKRFSKIIYFYTKKKIRDEHDVTDIVQNSFIKAYKGLDKFDSKKAFYPFLFTILKNEIADFYRKKKYDSKITEQTASYEEKFIDETQDFESLINKLKPEYQTVIKSYYIEGYSYKEIAVQLDKPINTVKTLIRRAKDEFKKHYEKNN
jgi:RNA polymerase sigma-70 factor (ECF subfamily)